MPTHCWPFTKPSAVKLILFLKNYNNDIWRFNHFLTQLSNKNTIINKFNTGNLDTLNKPNIRDKMIEFYNNYSSPNNAPASPYPVIEEDLTNWIPSGFNSWSDDENVSWRWLKNKEYKCNWCIWRRFCKNNS